MTVNIKKGSFQGYWFYEMCDMYVGHIDAYHLLLNVNVVLHIISVSLLDLNLHLQDLQSLAN